MRETPGSRAPGKSSLFVLLAAATLTVMAGATISPSLPGLLAHFADDPRADVLVPLILTAPGLAIALSAPLAGILLDRLSKRAVLAAAIVLYALAGSSGLYLSSLDAILVGRLVLGVAVGTIMTASLALVADLYQGSERERVMGWQGAAMSFGGVLFVGVGGLLGEIGWRGPFAVYLAPLALAWLALRALPARPLDVEEAPPGAASPAAAPFPWRHAFALYLLAGTSMLTFYVVPTLIPFVVEGLVGTAGTALLAGVAIGVTTLAAGLVSMQYQRIRARVSPPTIAALGFAGIAAGFAGIAAEPGFAVLLAALAVAGAGAGTIMPNNNSWLLSRVPEPVRGRASGGMTAALFLGQFACGFVGPVLVSVGGLNFVYLAMGVLAATLAVVLALVATLTAADPPALTETP